MRSNVEISIKIERKPTQAQASGPKTRARRIDEGHFQIVLDADKSLDITSDVIAELNAKKTAGSH